MKKGVETGKSLGEVGLKAVVFLRNCFYCVFGFPTMNKSVADLDSRIRPTKLKRVTTTDAKPIAVITVTFSPGDHLAAFLDSVREATVRGAYTVLADNGSTDGTPQAAAKERDGVEFFATGGNIGYGSAINAAARHLKDKRANGDIEPEFFVLANPDVVFDKGSIDVMLECAQRWPHAAAIGPYIRQSDGSAYPSARAIPTLSNGIGHALFGAIWPNNPWTKSYKDDADMSTERTAGWLSGSCLLVRWDAFDAIGGFDERYFMYMEDVDLGDRFGRAGFENVFCPSSFITHAVGHAAGKHPEKMLPAHHESAYRFQADRHPHAWQLPIRVVLKLGLQARAFVAVASAKLKK